MAANLMEYFNRQPRIGTLSTADKDGKVDVAPIGSPRMVDENTVIMALPAVVCYLIFGPLIWKNRTVGLLAAFGAGFGAVLLGAVLVGLALMFTEENFFEIASLVVIAHIPVMIIEGIVSAFCVTFLKKVQPNLLPQFGQT